nr:hypothetical protein [Chroococcidiopsis sp. SAG 2025]
MQRSPSLGKNFSLWLFLAIMLKKGDRILEFGMTIKRVVLSALTVLTVLLAGASLWQSWQQPQFQSRLELYETNLLCVLPSGNLKIVGVKI